MGQLSPQAKTRLAFLEFYKEMKDVTVVCKAFKISRETFYKWRRRFNPGDLSSLEDRPKTPRTKRGSFVSFKDEMRLKRFREDHIKQGKVKLSIMYEKETERKFLLGSFKKLSKSTISTATLSRQRR